MRTALGIRIAVALAVLPVWAAQAHAQYASDVGLQQWTREEMENLLAPVALYPDPILAQVLVAASYPDEVELAAQHVRLYGAQHIDDQPWDISVKAVAHYEPVLNLMADRPEWTVALGQAYAEQPQDVMDAVQSLRAMAQAHGNLVTTDEHEVYQEDRYIRIVPRRPKVVYVPVYDPLVVYHRPVVHLGVYRSGWSFGIGFPIGAWLAYDFDWGHRHIYYHGWDSYYHTGWIHRARPYVVINHIYVHPRPRIVVVNHRVIDRYVDYRRFDRYNYVHRRWAWDRRRPREDRRYIADGPSWDRERRAVPRGSDGSPDRSPWRARATQPQRAQPDRTRQQMEQNRPSIQRARPQTSQPRETQPSRIRPEMESNRSSIQRARPQVSQPRQTQPSRIRPQMESNRSSIQRARPQVSQPRPTQPSRIRPQMESNRSSIQRAAPQRSGNGRIAPANRPRPQVRSAPPARSGGQQRARPRPATRRSGSGS